MARLSVELPELMRGDRQAVLSGSIIDSNMEMRASFSLMEGSIKTFDLPAGSYTVQLSLPSGRSVARGVRIGEDQPGAVRMGPAKGSVPKWLAWSKLNGDVSRQQRRTEKKNKVEDVAEESGVLHGGDRARLRGGGRGRERVGSDRGVQRPAASPMPGRRVRAQKHRGFDADAGIWQRFFQFRHGNWQPITWAGNAVVTDGERWNFSVSANSGQLLAVQSGGLEVPWRFSLVPPGGAAILLQPGDEKNESQRGLQVFVSSRDLRAQTLLSYLQQGDYASLMTVGEDLINDAEGMLYSKISDPMGAAVGGYFLLVSENYERLHNWPNNFANWIDWLPDSAIVHGWQLMKQPGAQDPAAALERFLEAVKRGIPVFSVGLRYLYDALDYANRQLAADDTTKAAVEAAFETVTGWAQAADWTRPYTTLFGASPEQPDLLSCTGLPQDWTGLEFLPEIDTGLDQGEVSERYPPVAATSRLRVRANVVMQPQGQSWAVSLYGEDQPLIDIVSSLQEATQRAGELAIQHAPSRLVLFGDEGAVERFDLID